MSLCHFWKVNKDAGITFQEVDTLREEHWCITMGIKGYDMLMQSLCLLKGASLVNKPLENRKTIISEPFRMPLNSHNWFVLSTFYCLDNTIRRGSSSPETLSWIIDCLMMEGINF